MCPLSLGINHHRVIQRGTQLPVKKTTTYITALNWQRHMSFTIWEGESPLASENTKLGSLSMNGLPKAEAGEVGVDVTFELDENGILKVLFLQEFANC